MDKSKLILKLNWFYNLELNQVDFYHEQSKLLHDEYTKIAFGHFAEIEQQHVDNIANMIKDLGGNPFPITDIIAPIIGKVAGTLLSWTGTENVFKANIMIEKKASEDYKNLIEMIKGQYDEDMIKTLQGNLVDEDLHIAWLENQLQEGSPLGVKH